MGERNRPIRALVDADPIVYQAGFAVEKKQGKGKLVEPLSHALQAVKKEVATMQARVRELARESPVLFEFYLTGTGNFRDKVATIRPYKGNRDPLHKPYWYKEIRQYIRDTWSAQVIDGMEADDAVSIAQWNSPPFDTAICTADKDLLMVPGLYFNYQKNTTLVISEDDAWRAFYRQLLSGDTTDNIGGCYKIGKHRATRIIEQAEDEVDAYSIALSCYEISIDKYGNHYGGLSAEDALLENARLLWMLQYEGQVWEPPL